MLLNERAISGDLDNCWSVVAEAIQTILRREGYPHPYEALKALTRTNQAITEASIRNFIEELQGERGREGRIACHYASQLYGNVIWTGRKGTAERLHTAVEQASPACVPGKTIIIKVKGREANGLIYIE